MCSFPRDTICKNGSSAYTVIFSFSNADNSFAEKGFTRILLHDSSLCSLYKTQNKIIFHSSLLAPFVDSYYSPRGSHGRTQILLP